MIKSLKNRLLLWLLLPLLCVSFIALYDTKNYADKTANKIFDQTLAGSTIAIAERVVINANGQIDVDVPYIALDMLTSAAHDRIFYRVNANQSQYITGYKALKITGKAVNKISYSFDKDIYFYDGQFRGEAIRLAVLKGNALGASNNQTFEVLLAETTQARQILAQDILVSTGLRLGLLMVTALIFVWIGIIVGLKPLNHLRQAIGRRNPTDLHPITHNVPIEVESLIGGINNFMNRLENSLSALRNFTANAEHQIKTPLSVAKTNIYLSQNTTNITEKQNHLQIADHSIDNCERILSQLILLSKVENADNSHDNHQLDLVKQLERLVRQNYLTAKNVNIDLGVVVDIKTPTAEVTGNLVLFEEMLNNLIDNIIIHAKSCTMATLYLTEETKHYLITIEDNGIGIEAVNYALALERFGQVNNENNGSGLGLAIISEIMALFNGEMTLGVAQHEAQKNNPPNMGLSICLKFNKQN